MQQTATKPCSVVLQGPITGPTVVLPPENPRERGLVADAIGEIYRTGLGKALAATPSAVRHRMIQWGRTYGATFSFVAVKTPPALVPADSTSATIPATPSANLRRTAGDGSW